MITASPQWLRDYTEDFVRRMSPAGRGEDCSVTTNRSGVRVYLPAPVLVPSGLGFAIQADVKVFMTRTSEDRPVPDTLHEMGERHAHYPTVESIVEAEQKFVEADRRAEAKLWLKKHVEGKLFFGQAGAPRGIYCP